MESSLKLLIAIAPIVFWNSDIARSLENAEFNSHLPVAI